MPDETCAECKRHGTLSVWARDLGQDRDGFVSFCARHAPAHSTIMNRRLYELLDREKERATLHARAEAAERRVASLEGALRPFADAIRDDNEIVPGHWSLNAHTGLTIADLRQARAALAAPAPGATPERSGTEGGKD